MRRKLWMLLILFLFLVGRESCCALQEQVALMNKFNDNSEKSRKEYPFVHYISRSLIYTFSYWYFDLHQKEEGWYTCKFYYAAGYRTKLFYNRIYLDFYMNFLFSLSSLLCKWYERLIHELFMMNINVRIYRDFYIVLIIPILYCVQGMFLFFTTRFSSQKHIDN